MVLSLVVLFFFYVLVVDVPWRIIFFYVLLMVLPLGVLFYDCSMERVYLVVVSSGVGGDVRGSVYYLSLEWSVKYRPRFSLFSTA